MKIIVTGAAGYLGSRLIPELLKYPNNIVAIDTFWFGENTLPVSSKIKKIKEDIRTVDYSKLIEENDVVLHLACISNDPSFDLDPQLSKEINYVASLRLIDACQKLKIKRFIFASSSSVYGLKKEEFVTEDMSLEPITSYAFYKAEVEAYLKNNNFDFDHVILRPATLCGSSPRLRLDLVTHILASQAFFNKKMTLFGGQQSRPQLHIEDMVKAYVRCIFDSDNFNGEVYNVCYKNYKVFEIAETIKSILDFKVEVVTQEVNDNRSYRIDGSKFINSRQIITELSIESAIKQIFRQFKESENFDWMNDRYHNVKFLKSMLEKK